MNEKLVERVTTAIENALVNHEPSEDAMEAAAKAAIAAVLPSRDEAVEIVGDVIAHETAKQRWEDTDFYGVAAKALDALIKHIGGTDGK